nr:phage BR0599 family protein [uncultured Enterobacter sp.]
MSWSEYGSSVSMNRPVRLYEFIYGNSLFYRYTSADQNITLNKTEWQMLAISDEGISFGTDSGELSVTLPANCSVAILYNGIPPSSPVRLNIYEYQHNDDDKEIRAIWAGSVVGTKQTKTGMTELRAENLAVTFSRTGVRLGWGRACQNALYDQNCRVRPDQHAVRMTVTSSNGVGITVNVPAGVTDGWFSGGYIEFDKNGIIERRGARTHTGNVINLFGGAGDIRDGTQIIAYPGCNLVIDTCDSKFSNTLNFGGIPHLPGVNPWEIIKVF